MAECDFKKHEAFGAAGNIFGTEIKIQLAASATRVLGHGVTATAAGVSAGMLMVLCSANDFVEYTPRNGTRPPSKTEVRFAYDDVALYVGAIMFDAHPDSIFKR